MAVEVVVANRGGAILSSGDHREGHRLRTLVAMVWRRLMRPGSLLGVVDGLRAAVPDRARRRGTAGRQTIIGGSAVKTGRLCSTMRASSSPRLDSRQA